MKIKLKEILENQNKSIYSLSKDTGIALANLSKLVKGETSSIKYDNIDRICFVLDITPNEMFEIETPVELLDIGWLTEANKKLLNAKDNFNSVSEMNSFIKDSIRRYQTERYIQQLEKENPNFIEEFDETLLKARNTPNKKD